MASSALPDAVRSAKVIYPAEFANGDPNTMTCHACHGKPVAMCTGCGNVICKIHKCACTNATKIQMHGLDAPAFLAEKARRYAAWKGPTP